MASALASAESFEEETKRINNEKNLYHDLKEYLIAINQLATNYESKLWVLASGYRSTLENFIFMVYTCKRWRNYVTDGLSKYVEEKYHEKVATNQNRPCTWTHTVVIADMLHCYQYFMKSAHTNEQPLVIFQHGQVF